jgi:hypothetical protein
MTLPQAMELFDYWQDAPPEHEILAMLARVYTTWKPQSVKPKDHQASLEERWAAGAMNAKQIFEAMGGAKAASVGADGTFRPVTGDIDPFPGEKRCPITSP